MTKALTYFYGLQKLLQSLDLWVWRMILKNLKPLRNYLWNFISIQIPLFINDRCHGHTSSLPRDVQSLLNVQSVNRNQLSTVNYNMVQLISNRMDRAYIFRLYDISTHAKVCNVIISIILSPLEYSDTSIVVTIADLLELKFFEGQKKNAN